ncbi:deoxyguanosinetriphosphate triphosphohydrolase [Lipingzhangella sp. LS1_29]|uniref:Deoxyguanosinetriphosphate triphosphohydrolase n=1 Tax=Lipingzhangella rawalii TaxID=2055835 RepID=A0ABU2H9E8_9ACTN|nr:deoxyguanosinetriphosphate triphosphohydrolase [Lipingzhangella rawalii]MDS1271219.1 deoxyguanosinetriphosphate triphosphohydrolase [Lipingzhangella rawalii]
MPSYHSHDRQRRVSEPAKSDGRSPFERDRARVLHSFSLRRLAAKTQVVQPGVSDFPRTRLTHSLECAQIGRELGSRLGCDPDLVEAACLAHDLGHPPFGHNGEAALDAAARDCGGFEGNAQSLRLLTRLESKVLDPDGASAGLNLTRATLDATVKYPWTCAQTRTATRGPAAAGKFGCYTEDIAVLDWIRAHAPHGRRCLEAQVMDWADDVAYSVHDVEDGLYAGMILPETLDSDSERQHLAELAARSLAESAPGLGAPLLDDAGRPPGTEELRQVLEDLLGEPFWPRQMAGDLRSLARLKDLTSALIGRFCGAAERATLARQRAEAQEWGRYTAELIVPRRQVLECALLKAIAVRYVLGRDGAREHQEWERGIVTELVAAVAHGAPATLDPALRPGYVAAGDDAAALRVVIDQVASLTDTSALAWHRELCG